MGRAVTSWASESLCLLAKASALLLPYSLGVHALLFYVMIYHVHDAIGASWLCLGLLVVYPIRVSVAYSILDNAAKGRVLYGGLLDRISFRSACAQFVNNFLWWGYTGVTLFIVSPFLPDDPELGKHAALLLLAVCCVPTALTDCLSHFEELGAVEALKGSCQRVMTSCIPVVLTYLVFFEGWDYLARHLQDFFEPIIDDGKLRAMVVLTLTAFPLYVVSWTGVFAQFWSSRHEGRPARAEPDDSQDVDGKA